MHILDYLQNLLEVQRPEPLSYVKLSVRDFEWLGRKHITQL